MSNIMLDDIKTYLSVQDLAVKLIVSSFNNPDFEDVFNIGVEMTYNSSSYLDKLKNEYVNGKLSKEQFIRLYAAAALMKASDELMNFMD